MLKSSKKKSELSISDLSSNITTSKHKETHQKSYSDLDIEAEKRVEKSLIIVHPLIIDTIDLALASKMTNDELIDHLRPIISKILNEQSLQLNAKEQAYLEKRLVDDMLGLGPLEYLLYDDSINDILVNSTKSIYIERDGVLEKSHIRFQSDEQILNVISRIVAIIGRRVDETTPYVDARLHDGSRINAIIPPLALDGPCISIRKFRRDSITLDSLVENETLSKNMAEFLKIAVICRRNIIILGGTGSGKTTLLNALSQHIPDSERIITIEDSAELQLQQEHVVRLETRTANVEGKGAITERDLVKNALRMRPDRIILGEIRGEEAFDLLQAMNTGHDGSLSTIHASSTAEVAARIINMVLMAGFKLPPESILGQVANSIHLLVQISRMPNGKRKVTNISEIIAHDTIDVTTQSIFNYNPVSSKETDNTEFQRTDVMPKLIEVAKFYGLSQKLKKTL